MKDTTISDSKRPVFRVVLIIVIFFSSFIIAAFSQNNHTNQPSRFLKKTSDIAVNQVAYLSQMPKSAIFPNIDQDDYVVLDKITNTVALRGKLSSKKYSKSARKFVRIADFSQVDIPGEYVLKVENTDLEVDLKVDDSSIVTLHDAVLKAFYFNRASTKLKSEYADKWYRNMGHPDNEILVHYSAASASRPEGYVISAPKGWYDAADYNKYVVNGAISTATLLYAYLEYTDFYSKQVSNIPESFNGIPDILDEALWSLEWLIKMQDPCDGGVYHKLTAKRFSKSIMPSQDMSQRFVVQKSTNATLSFSSVMALASRVFSEFPEYREISNKFADAALLAFNWSKDNPDVVFKQPNDIKTGLYFDSNFEDEFAWAAAELFLLRKEHVYLEVFQESDIQVSIPSWRNTSFYSHLALLSADAELLGKSQMNVIERAVLELGLKILDDVNDSAFGIPMKNRDFEWGSNSIALNKSIVALTLYKATKNEKFLHVAISIVDYILGKNPIGYSYVTGFGLDSPIQPHHRQSMADQVREPVPGFLVGGPNYGKQDKCDYPHDAPAMSYIDSWCSYASNEVAINWNASLVFSLAGVITFGTNLTAER